MKAKIYKEDYFADITRRQNPVKDEAKRREQLEHDYHCGPVAKLLEKYSQDGRDEVNKYVQEWNEVVMNSTIPFRNEPK